LEFGFFNTLQNFVTHFSTYVILLLLEE